MPRTDSLRFRIGNRDIDVEDIEATPVAIDYALEDAENFEQKKSSEAYNIVLPATQNNSQSFNSPANPNVEDLTANDFFSSPQPCVIEANGVELLKGKAFLVEATHTDRPEKITVNCYGNNADWVIDLKDKTLADFVNPADSVFNRASMQSSWNFDGRSETADYVYAPVRYSNLFKDGALAPEDLKPSLSIYWILWRGFKSMGYKIESTFLDSDYFRRLVMPWTWGDFLYTDDVVQAPYLFRRVCTQAEEKEQYIGAWNEYVSPNSGAVVKKTIQWNDVNQQANQQPGGGFEGTPGISEWIPPAGLTYLYPANSVLGYVTAGFELQLYYYVYNDSAGKRSWGLYADWSINGVAHSSDLLYQYPGDDADSGTVVFLKQLNLNPGDRVTLKIRISAGDSGISPWRWQVGNTYAQSQTNNEPPSHLWLRYFKKAVGSPVRLSNYPAFKKYKWLDLLRGVADAFNLAIQTDPMTRTVTIEPTHEYGRGQTRTPGYLGKGALQWTEKQDLSKISSLQLYSDCEREFDFKFRDDSSDGGVSILNKRHTVEIGAGRYLLPDRFKSGKKEYQNRFFSPVVHAPIAEWENLVPGIMPQLVALVSENASDDSKVSQAFEPKLCYYKGQVTGAGGWKWNPAGSVGTRTTLPYMFAVNYHTGGEVDPVLTYSDQRIGTGIGNNAILGEGLMRRFFLPRLAIMRHGRLYKTWMKLDMNDITNWLHRESIIITEKKYYLISIDKYQPLRDDTTAVTLWQWEPLSPKDDAAVMPSRNSVLATGATPASSDLTYTRAMLLSVDLPAVEDTTT